ncbi:uncharacterized protein I303_100655 [Kwoniella dejecticola CBS 10117]|uniref:Ubiquitin-like domain-containing protein n=1 Tax=Kwoniella dejecticola CBS 10117 TaxID=1296121 RepID=A0A1A6AFI9_9TREE|nr:uncharacterized protein I303_00659 [Kwoniella dejecticola CBS 10117]OBR88842.1 hypothetical protein I303_00659 [Kwoniella dejecticola CBS 10117]
MRAGKKMMIFVGTEYQGGRQFHVSLRPAATTEELVQAISAHESIPPQSFIVQHPSISLLPSSPLVSQGIKEYSTVHLYRLEDLRQKELKRKNDQKEEIERRGRYISKKDGKEKLRRRTRKALMEHKQEMRLAARGEGQVPCYRELDNIAREYGDLTVSASISTTMIPSTSASTSSSTLASTSTSTSASASASASALTSMVQHVGAYAYTSMYTHRGESNSSTGKKRKIEKSLLTSTPLERGISQDIWSDPTPITPSDRVPSTPASSEQNRFPQAKSSMPAHNLSCSTSITSPIQSEHHSAHSPRTGSTTSAHSHSHSPSTSAIDKRRSSEVPPTPDSATDPRQSPEPRPKRPWEER